MKVVASGYFNPLHEGHLAYLKAARELGDYLIVIVNNDRQVKLKGSKPFQNVLDRASIVGALRFVDEVVIAKDKTRSVTETLAGLKPDIFATGADHTKENTPDETELCEQLGIKIVYGVGGEKINSSSKLKETL